MSFAVLFYTNQPPTGWPSSKVLLPGLIMGFAQLLSQMISVLFTNITIAFGSSNTFFIKISFLLLSEYLIERCAALPKYLFIKKCICFQIIPIQCFRNITIYCVILEYICISQSRICCSHNRIATFRNCKCNSIM